MRASTPTLKFGVLLIGIFFLLGAAVACQSDEEVSPTNTVSVVASTLPPPQATVIGLPTTPAPTPTATSIPPTATTVAPTPVAPTPTPPITPTPTPAPPPVPTFYTVQAGDTLFGIAEQFGVSVDKLVFANGYASQSELPLVAGRELQIPLCVAHRISPGNTLGGIAQICGFTLDDLVITNIKTIAPLGSIDSIPVGFVLIYPQESLKPFGLDCSLGADREQVIEYTPRAGEGIFCMSQKFGVATAAIIQANVQRLTGDNVYSEVGLLIPPFNGAVYIITAGDVDNGVELADLADWYDVDVEAITDWNGNPVTDPLTEGRQLFVAGGTLAFGPFQSQTAEE